MALGLPVDDVEVWSDVLRFEMCIELREIFLEEHLVRIEIGLHLQAK